MTILLLLFLPQVAPGANMVKMMFAAISGAALEGDIFWQCLTMRDNIVDQFWAQMFLLFFDNLTARVSCKKNFFHPNLFKLSYPLGIYLRTNHAKNF